MRKPILSLEDADLNPEESLMDAPETDLSLDAAVAAANEADDVSEQNGDVRGY